MYSKEDLEKMRKEGQDYVEQQEIVQKEKRDGATKSEEFKNKGRPENKTMTLLIAILSVSLVVNYFSIQKINDLEADVERQSNEMRSLSDRIHQVSWRLNEYQEAEKWIAEIRFEPNEEESNQDNIVLDVQWELRESEEGATVTFLYRGNEDEKWKEVQALAMDTNTFHASIHLHPKKDYEYQILSQGIMNKSSEVNKVPVHFYQLIPVMLTSSSSAWSSSSPNDLGELTHFEASFSQENVPFDFFKVKEINAHYYINDQLQKTESLTRTKNANNFDEWSFKADPEMTLIKLEILYENGDVQWEVINPHDEQLLDPTK